MLLIDWIDFVIIKVVCFCSNESHACATTRFVYRIKRFRSWIQQYDVLM